MSTIYWRIYQIYQSIIYGTEFRNSNYAISGTGTTINSDDEQLKQYAGCLTDYTITKQ